MIPPFWFVTVMVSLGCTLFMALLLIHSWKVQRIERAYWYADRDALVQIIRTIEDADDGSDNQT